MSRETITKMIKVGDIFGYLKVIKKDLVRGWVCECLVCGNLRGEISGTVLRRGVLKSCGCASNRLKSESNKQKKNKWATLYTN